MEKLDCWEFQEDKVIIWFNTESRECEFYTYELPLDILFDPNFKQKMKARVEEAREKERLRIIERQSQRQTEKQDEEIRTLHELMKKYPGELVRR